METLGIILLLIGIATVALVGIAMWGAAATVESGEIALNKTEQFR
jgi:hypothetical protein